MQDRLIKHKSNNLFDMLHRVMRVAELLSAMTIIKSSDNLQACDATTQKS